MLKDILKKAIKSKAKEDKIPDLRDSIEIVIQEKKNVHIKKK